MKKDMAAVGLSRETCELNRRLARRHGTTQTKLAEAAIALFAEHVDGVDVIGVPDLISGVSDLEATVGRLVRHLENLERLAYHLAAAEAVRYK